MPDLDDPATLGCLLALVREAIPTIRIYDPPMKTIGVQCEWLCDDGTTWWKSRDTLAELLVSALEDAP